MNVKQDTLFVIGGMTQLLERIPAHVYASGLPALHGGTIGQQFGRILSFYACLLDGAQRNFVDYDARRHSPELSEKTNAALAVLDFVREQLGQLDEERWIHVYGEFNTSKARGERPMLVSSIGRELQGALDHAAYHLALVRVSLELYFPEIKLPSSLAALPPTMKHHWDAPPRTATPRPADDVLSEMYHTEFFIG